MAGRSVPAGTALRADAARNREQLIDAARHVFAEQGLHAPLQDIAERAGVGIATLYRRFPTREDLVAASFDAKLNEYVGAAETALQDQDPWRGFCEYVARVCAMQADDRGLRDVLTMSFPRVKGLEKQRRHAHELVVELLRRAQEAGALRPDLTTEDLVLMLMANAGVVQATGDAAPDAWRRIVALMLSGCRANAVVPLPPPPSPRQLTKAMAGLLYRRRSRRVPP